MIHGQLFHSGITRLLKEVLKEITLNPRGVLKENMKGQLLQEVQEVAILLQDHRLQVAATHHQDLHLPQEVVIQVLQGHLHHHLPLQEVQDHQAGVNRTQSYTLLA